MFGDFWIRDLICSKTRSGVGVVEPLEDLTETDPITEPVRSHANRRGKIVNAAGSRLSRNRKSHDRYPDLRKTPAHNGRKARP